jgi:hypothetical protein
VVQAVTAVHTASEESVAAVEVYVPSVLGSQVVIASHTRSEKAVGAAAWYWLEEHAAEMVPQTRFVVLVGAVDSYSTDG